MELKIFIISGFDKLLLPGLRDLGAQGLFAGYTNGM